MCTDRFTHAAPSCEKAMPRNAMDQYGTISVRKWLLPALAPGPGAVQVVRGHDRDDVAEQGRPMTPGMILKP